MKKIYKNLTMLFLVIFAVFTSEKSFSQWVLQNSISSESPTIIDMKFSDSNTGYISGYAYDFNYVGRVYKTINGGSSWSPLTIPTSKRAYFISAVNSNNVYVSCDSNTIIKTVNGGSSWNILTTPTVTTTENVRWQINFIDANTGWISTTRSSATQKTFKTTNGGSSWVLANASIGVYGFVFFDNNNGYGINSSYSLLKTTNSGSTWSSILNDSLIYSISFLDVNTGWAFTSRSYYFPNIKGKSYKTTNGGQTWNLQYSNDTTYTTPYNVKFFDSQTGYASNSYSPSSIIKTTNGGINWFNPTNIRLGYASVLNFLNMNSGWLCDNYQIFRTTSGAGNLNNPFFADLFKVQNSNNISNNISNGKLTYEYGNSLGGMEWPKGSGHKVAWGSGFVIGAQINGQTRISQSYNAANFTPGKFDGSGIEVGSNLGEYGLYQINSGNGNGTPDWDNWPISQGAPFNGGNPQSTGNQTTFESLSDGVNGGNNGETSPLKAEVKFLSYTFNDNLRKDAQYYRFDVTNKSNSNWNNAYFSFFVDPDLGDRLNDRFGSDSALGLVYTYNGSTSDTAFGNTPPAMGYKLISSPNGVTLSSCTPFYNNNSIPTPPDCNTDPYLTSEFYNMQQGLDKCGSPFIYNGQPKKFVYNGNPEAGSGWNSSVSGDVRMTMNIGPFNLAPNQTSTFIVVALIAQGTNNLNSVTKLKQYAATIPISVQTISSNLPKQFSLSQNYPNPFNPTTNIKFEIPKSEFVNIRVFDIVGREVKELVNQNMSAGEYKVDFDGSSLESGVYFYRITAGSFVETRKMILVK